MAHKVKQGESLSKIAKKYGTTVDELVKLNKIENANHILVGQNIEIPETPQLVSRSEASQKPKQTPKSNTSKSEPEVKPTSKVKIGDARYVQQQLVNAGYDVGSKGVDGRWGNDSLAALNKAMSQGYKLENDILYRDFAENPTYERIPVNANWQPYKSPYTNDSVCPYGQCAEMANRQLYSYKDPNDRPYFTPDDIGGHAWTRLTNENGKLLYSGYVDSQDNSKKYTDAQLAQMGDTRNARAAERFAKTFDIRSLDPNRAYMVNMYYQGSGSTAQAWKEGKDGITGTHTGNVFYDPEKQQWLVYHNIGKKDSEGNVYGDIHVEPLETLFGVDRNPDVKKRRNYSITAISEAVPRTEAYMYRDKPDKKYTAPGQKPAVTPKKQSKPWYQFWKQGGLISKKAGGGPVENEEKPKLVKKKEPTEPVKELEHTLPEVTVTNIGPRPIFEESPELNTFVNTLNSTRNAFMQTYNLSDKEWSDMAALAVNLTGSESSFGLDPVYKRRRDWIPDGVMRTGKWLMGRDNPNDLSRGLTQIKYTLDLKEDPELKKRYHANGITEDGITYNPAISAKATMIRLQRNKEKLGDIYGYRWSDETPIAPDEVQAIYWNRGRLTDKANPNPLKERDYTDLDEDEKNVAVKYIRNFRPKKLIK